MPDLAQAFKAEIQRLARRELKLQLDPLRKQITQQRKDIASLKKAVQTATKQRPAARPVTHEVVALGHRSGRLRFTAQGFRTNRKRLGLSVEQMAELIGVSTATIYNWEQGKTSPRQSQLPAIAALRGVGKREIVQRLEKIPSGSEKSP